MSNQLSLFPTLPQRPPPLPPGPRDTVAWCSVCRREVTRHVNEAVESIFLDRMGRCWSCSAANRK